MSFEILLTRTVVPGIDKQLEDPGARPLTPQDFALIMDGAPVRRRLEDGSLWLWHPQGMAWLSAAYKTDVKTGDGYISFALSYAHNQFLKVFADAFELALRLSQYLGARIFEDTGYGEITAENAGELLSPHGSFVLEQASLWQATVADLDGRIQAPLEYPLGRFDAVNDYFVFFLEAAAQVDMRSLVRQLSISVPPESLADNCFALQDPDSGSVLARVLKRPDGALQIRPFYWMEPFAVVAAATLDLSCRLQDHVGGRLFMRDKPFTPELQAAVAENIKGLGVEFFLWLQSQERK
jgi:hypothetical protein